MATAIQKLHDNFLSCIICTELYKEPRTLSCGHTFCRVCLVQYTKTQKEAVKAKSIPCPNCRHFTKTSSPEKPVEEWIGQLKASFLIQGLLDDFASAEDVEKHCFSCLQHGEKTTGTSHCLDCDITICDRCVKTHRALPGTSHHVISDLAGEVNVKRKRKVICKTHNSIVEFCCKDCKKAICQKCCILDHRKCDNVVTIESMVPEMKGIIIENKKMMRRKIEQIESDFAQRKTKVKQLEGDMASIDSRIRQASQKAINLIKQKEEKLRAEVDDLREKQLGNLKGNLKSEEIDMQMYQQHCQFIDQALTAAESEMDIYEMYQICQSEMIRPAADVAPAEESSDGTEMTFVEEIDEQMIDTHVQLGSIKLLKKEFDPKRKGVLIDTISIDAKDDKCIPDPYDVTVLVVNGTDVLIVTDCRNDCLKSFYKSKGKKRHSKLSLDSSPSCVTKLNRNQFVAVSFWSHNEIIIVHVTPDLVIVSTFTTQQIYKSLTALTPTTLVASCASSVHVLDTKGKLTRSLDSVKTVQNLIKCPYFISRSLAGNILISDPGSHALYCLTPEGKQVFTFHPTGNTALKGPRGIATTFTGDILLADYGNNTVIQLSPTGKFVRNILTSNDGIIGPFGICLHNDKLYVAEAEKNVKVFRFN